MKKLLSYLMIVMLAFSFSGCSEDYSGEIDDLQKQIEDLDKKIDDLEKAQQEALLAEIAKLQALIDNMASDLGNIKTDLSNLQGDVSDNYSELLEKLGLLEDRINVLEDEISSGGENVYYGDLFTDDDFAAFKAQGATIVSGKVAVTKQQHITDLNAVKMISNNFSIAAGTIIELPYLETLGGDLNIFSMPDVGATISFPVLRSIADDFIINNPVGLESISMPELLVVFKDIYGLGLVNVHTLSLPKLDLANSITLTASESNNRGLASLDLSAVNVIEDVVIKGLDEGAQVYLGVVGADIKISDSHLSHISFQNSEIYGDLVIEACKFMTRMTASNLTKVAGNFIFNSNFGGDNLGGDPIFSGFESGVMKAFDKLEEVGLDFSFANNTIQNVNAFHAVTSVGQKSYGTSAGNLSISENIGIEQIYVFSNITYVEKAIDIVGECDYFIGFNSLEEHNRYSGDQRTGGYSLYVNLYQRWENNAPVKTCRIDAFDALTSTGRLILNLAEVTLFGDNTFASLSNLTGEKYLTVYLPVADEAMYGNGDFSTCTMSALLTRVKDGEFDFNENYKAEFYDYYGGNLLDYATGVDALLANCN